MLCHKVEEEIGRGFGAHAQEDEVEEPDVFSSIRQTEQTTMEDLNSHFMNITRFGVVMAAVVQLQPHNPLTFPVFLKELHCTLCIQKLNRRITAQYCANNQV